MNAIAELRKALGLSQAELSRRSGIKQQTICMLETGKRKTPRLDTAAKLAAALNCTVDELLQKGENEDYGCVSRDKEKEITEKSR